MRTEGLVASQWPADPEVDLRIRGLALWLAQRSDPRTSNPSRFADERAMAIVRDSDLQVPLMRLIDVAPACQTPMEVAEHLGALLADVDTRQPLIRAIRRLARTPGMRSATGRLALHGVRRMARRFVVGETACQSVSTLRRLWQRGTAISVDLLGERTATPAEGQAYAAHCDETMTTLTAIAEGWPERPLLEHDGAGLLPRVNLSVKVTALTPLVRAEAPQRGKADAAEPLRHLLRRARDLGAHLHIDMESFDAHELVLGLALETLAEPEFAAGPSAGIVLQAYLRESEKELDRILEWARATPRAAPLSIRLVKGAYWDHEWIEAIQHGWTPPVWTEKHESDRCFERLTRRLIDAFPLVRTAIASHNPRSVAHAVVYAREAGLAPQDFELQVLRGLGDGLRDALAVEGLRARTYCPIGRLVEGMAYLVRRLLENSSNDSFLARRASGAELDRLLACP